MKISKKLVSAVLAATVALGGLGLVDLPIGSEVQKAEAASVSAYGMVINPVKDNFTIGTDSAARVAIGNTNGPGMEFTYQLWPQKKQSDGTWMMHGSVIKSGRVVYGTTSYDEFAIANKANTSSTTYLTPGTYRYKMEDGHNTIWSSEFVVK